MIVKAPSSESIKSWNVAEAETLIRKSNIEAIEASVLDRAEQEREYDPFDTTEYEEVVAELKAKEVDPFDTSALGVLGPSKTELRLIEGEILEDNPTTDLENKSNLDILADLERDAIDDSVDPFDTDFAAEVLPDKGDPFDTTHLDPSLKKEEELDEDFDPFDTTVADKVLPVRKPRISQRSTVSIEDEDFDPENSFKVKKARRPPPPRPVLPSRIVDPFSIDTEEKDSVSPGKILTPVTEHKDIVEETDNWANEKTQELRTLEEELLNDIGGPLKRSFTDDDFDPRGSPEPERKPVPEEPEVAQEEEEDDPFDTSAIQVI